MESARVEADRERRLAAEAFAHLEAHLRANAVAELAHGLDTGDPCPVCNVPLAAPVAVDPDAGAVLVRVREAEADASAAAATAADAETRAVAEATAGDRHLERCRADLVEALAGHADLAALRTAAEVANHAAEDASAALTQRRSGRDGAQTGFAAAHDAMLEARGELSRLQEVGAAARAALQAVRERKTQAAAIVADHFGGTLPTDATARLEGDRTRLKEATEAEKAARRRLDELAQSYDAAGEEVDRAERRVAEIDVRLTRARTRAETVATAAHQLLDESLDRIPEPVAARQVTNTDLTAWCDGVAERLVGDRDRTASARDAATRGVIQTAAEQELEASTADQALAVLRTAERAAGSAAERAEAQVMEAQRRADERADMEARIADERVQLAVLGDLANELRADRFGEYIVQETLGLLAARASDELLRISDGRYSLVPEESEFAVVDHANADERRSVKTLSGGETFLASLALALSLSRHVGELATEGLGAKLEAVFIDEGFGTLDPETLEEVIDALERLRAENLVIGVISHVPALAERVRAGIEVRKDEGYSRIVQSAAA